MIEKMTQGVQCGHYMRPPALSTDLTFTNFWIKNLFT